MIPGISEYWAYRIGGWLCGILPREQAYWVGLRMADRFYALDRKGRRAVMANLEQVYRGQGIEPSALALEAGARRMYQLFGKYLVDFFRYARLTREELDRLISIQQIGHLQEAHALGKGVLMVTAHLGNWELGGAALAALGYRVHAVFLQHRLRKTARLFQHQREKRGIHPIPLGRAAAGIIRALKQGDLVALLADRDFSANARRTPFFGRPARLPLGPARIALRTGAPVLPAFLLREADDTYVFRFRKMICPDPAAGIEALHDRLCAVLEDEIARSPHQWFVFEPFWDEPPAGKTNGGDPFGEKHDH